uniref:Uncharacterized protein n=1 Tax=Pseudo-nitzschia delicatissima TaxID=44447 RepID=A0A7S0UKW2_9STRA|mmetsp:Transcript_4304/g.8960  ORF Transcript_4304/g.8960 Transcript_4304/m.8960 type:complete len:207 (+) Transcript_4304:79-699(+)
MTMSVQKKRIRKSSMKRLAFENDSDPIQSNEAKSVQFSTIEVRDYSLCLGDHPDVNRGAPVSLDWEYQSEQSFDLEEYEQRCFGRGKKTHNGMIRLAFEREYMLRKLGYSEDEIKTRSQSVKKDQKNRSQTRRTMIFEPFLIMSEETKRWIAKKKTHKNKIDIEINKPMRSSSGDSIITTLTASEMSSSYRASSTFMAENMIVCNQ